MCLCTYSHLKRESSNPSMYVCMCVYVCVYVCMYGIYYCLFVSFLLGGEEGIFIIYIYEHHPTKKERETEGLKK